jgi:hypothetical protein
LHLDFISAEQEQALLKHIDSQPWSSLAKRRVQHYGYAFEYSQRGVDPQRQLGELPEWVQPLLPRMQVKPAAIHILGATAVAHDKVVRSLQHLTVQEKQPVQQLLQSELVRMLHTAVLWQLKSAFTPAGQLSWLA